jgi:hypothetical protein
MSVLLGMGAGSHWLAVGSPVGSTTHQPCIVTDCTSARLKTWVHPYDLTINMLKSSCVLETHTYARGSQSNCSIYGVPSKGAAPASYLQTIAYKLLLSGNITNSYILWASAFTYVSPAQPMKGSSPLLQLLNRQCNCSCSSIQNHTVIRLSLTISRI